MLEINLGTIEHYDEEKNQFIYEEGGVVRFEYTLKTLYEWEAKWRKPFLKGEYNLEELRDFFLMMALDPVDPVFLTTEVMSKLATYVGETPTATTFNESRSHQNGNNLGIGKIYTAEEIYGLMFMNQVPIEFEERNLNRLLVILRVISNYNKPKEKMSRDDIYEQNRRLNAERREKYKTKG